MITSNVNYLIQTPDLVARGHVAIINDITMPAERLLVLYDLLRCMLANPLITKQQHKQRVRHLT